jgi:hypothetical protein
MILGISKTNRSPIRNQDFIWVADYYDGTYLSEFDFTTFKSNNFYGINKEKLIRFGLIGQGTQFYFDVGNGVFTLDKHRISVSYRTKDNEYPLTGRTLVYNDIITYKNAVADANIFNRSEKSELKSFITQYSIGYKKRMDLSGANINFYCLFCLPYRDSMHMKIKISSDIDLDGYLVFRRNGKIVDEVYSPLLEKRTGMIDWNIK